MRVKCLKFALIGVYRLSLIAIVYRSLAHCCDGRRQLLQTVCDLCIYGNHRSEIENQKIKKDSLYQWRFNTDISYRNNIFELFFIGL